MPSNGSGTRPAGSTLPPPTTRAAISRARACRLCSSASIGLRPAFLSAPEADAFRIVERGGGPLLHHRLAIDLDGIVVVFGLFAHDIAIDDGLANRVAEIAAAGDSQHLAVAQDRLAAEDRHFLFEGEDAKQPVRAILRNLVEGGTADEVDLLTGDQLLQ